jgi:hypothetical protein
MIRGGRLKLQVRIAGEIGRVHGQQNGPKGGCRDSDGNVCGAAARRTKIPDYFAGYRRQVFGTGDDPVSEEKRAGERKLIRGSRTAENSYHATELM